MIIQDDVIAVRHVIVCAYCTVSADNPYDGMFGDMNSWLNHKHLTGHIKASHTVAIVGGTQIHETDFEYVHTFPNYRV